MGSIERRGKNSWRIRVYTLVGDRYRWVSDTLKYPPSMSPEDQELAAGVELQKLEAAVHGDASQSKYWLMTFADYCELYINDHLVGTSPDNQKTVRNVIAKRLIPLLGDKYMHDLDALTLERAVNAIKATPKNLQSISPEQRVRKSAKPDKLVKDVAEYKAMLAKRSKEPPLLSDRSVYNYVGILDAMLDKAVAWTIIKTNPLASLKRPKYRKKKKQILNDDQCVQLLRQLALEENMTFRTAVLLALTCGLRLGEVGGLLWSDIDFVAGTVDISRALKYTPDMGNFIGDTKSVAGERVMELAPGMLTLLDETRKYQAYAQQILGDRWRGIGRIICRWDGTPYTKDTPSKQFTKFARKHGYAHITFHSLRHSHATILFANNIDAVAVASRMGHSDAATTLREYAQALKRRDHDSAKVMQHLIERAIEPEKYTVE